MVRDHFDVHRLGFELESEVLACRLPDRVALEGLVGIGALKLENNYSFILANGKPTPGQKSQDVLHGRISLFETPAIKNGRAIVKIISITSVDFWHIQQLGVVHVLQNPSTEDCP